MVTIVSNTATSEVATQGNTLTQWLMQNAGALILGILFLIAVIVIYILWKKMEEKNKERDDPVYEAYKKQLADAELNADKKKIRKTYSMANLFFLGIPIIWNEHSAKIVNYTNELIGYYRGESYSMDGYINFILYKKKFLFFENKFILKCPWSVKAKKIKRDKDNKIVMKNNKPVLEIVHINDYQKYIQKIGNGDVKILCHNTEKKSYFSYPVYLSTQDSHIIDYRNIIGDDLVEMTHSTMNARILSTGSQMVEKAMRYNPSLKYEQMSPEKTKEEQIND